MPDYETFRCERHGLDVPILTKTEAESYGVPFGCPDCTREVDGPDPATMTGDERADEVTRWLKSPVTVAFDLMHKRIEELVGRPVWTHEMARDYIIEEARSWSHPVDLEAHVLGSLDQIAGNKPVITARVGDIPPGPREG